MKIIDALSKIIEFGQPVLRTTEVAAVLKLTPSHASKLLRRLSDANVIVALKRGLWLIDKKMSAYQLVGYLAAPMPCYLSLNSALYLHGIISQIPETIYVITVARAHKLQTPLGSYSFHHVKPEFFFGFNKENKGNIPMAIPEKALIDHLYLIPARSKLFHTLPEITLPDNFDIQLAADIIQKIPSKRTRSLVSKRFQVVLQEQSIDRDDY